MEKRFDFLNRMKSARLASLQVLFLMGLVVSPAYAVVPPSTATTAATTSATTMDDCEEPAIQAGLLRNWNARVATQLQAGEEAEIASMKQFAKNPMRVHMDIGKTMCIDVLLEKQKTIADLIKGKGDLGDFFDDILKDLANQACAYAQQNIETALNNALNLLCIPIPNLGFFTLDLPSLERTSCDGVSLADFMQFRGVAVQSFSSRVPNSYMGAPLTRMIDINTNSSGVGAGASGWGDWR